MSLVKSISEFKKHIGKNVYIVNTGELFVAATTKKEINEKLKDLEPSEIDTIIFAIDDPNIMIYGLVLDPRELPYEVPDEFSEMQIYLLAPDFGGDLVDCTPYKTMEELTEEIESMVEDAFNIEDFAVVIGRPIKPVLQIMESTTPIDSRKIYI